MTKNQDANHLGSCVRSDKSRVIDKLAQLLKANHASDSTAEPGNCETTEMRLWVSLIFIVLMCGANLIGEETKPEDRRSHDDLLPWIAVIKRPNFELLHAHKGENYLLAVFGVGRDLAVCLQYRNELPSHNVRVRNALGDEVIDIFGKRDILHLSRTVPLKIGAGVRAELIVNDGHIYPLKEWSEELRMTVDVSSGGKKERILDTRIHLPNPAKRKHRPLYKSESGPPSANSIDMLFVPIPKKSFQMGVFEVTQAEFEKVMGKSKNVSRFEDPNNPVEQVSWTDAVEFCRKLSLTPEEKAAGHTYRLPTMEEWEYACRAGTTTSYSFGDDWRQLGQYGWFDENSQKRPHWVGQKKPNPWGLYDMHGNVWEWCQDRVGQAGNPEGLRVSLGGAWLYGAGSCQPDEQHLMAPSAQFSTIGFRVVRVTRARAENSDADSPPAGPRAPADSATIK